jgi:hypothetical protein
VRSTGATSRSSKACGSPSHAPVEVEVEVARLVIICSRTFVSTV